MACITITSDWQRDSILAAVLFIGARQVFGNDKAFEIVKAIEAQRVAQKKETVFRRELAELRTTWKAKRNFMKLLATLD